MFDDIHLTIEIINKNEDCIEQIFHFMNEEKRLWVQ